MGYDPGENSPRDLARGLLGDTDDKRPILPDETYESVLARYRDAGEGEQTPPTLGAMIELARRCAQRMRLLARSESVGDTSRSYGDRAAGFEELASDWGANGLPGPDTVYPSPLPSASGRLAEPDVGPLTRHL